MKLYQESRWLGNFLVAFGASLLLALLFFFHVRSEFAEAFAQFNGVTTEHTRFEQLNPFPSEENFRKLQSSLASYAAALDKAKDDLKTHIVPAAPLAPNEFQSRLRAAIVNTAEKARANGVKLPGNFCLGFDEFAAALPDTGASSVLGQQLDQVELLVNILIDNRVDVIADLKRPVARVEPPQALATAAQKPLTEPPKVIERSVVDVAFTASPTALRKVLNRIAGFDRQLFIVRTLHVRNEQPKGPSREQTGDVVDTGVGSNESTSPTAIKFIVGNEHLEAAATVELVRFPF